MDKELPRFSTHQVVSAETETLRGLVMFLVGKKIMTEPELILTVSFAKERLENTSHYPAEIGKRASAYVDVLLGGLLRNLGPSQSH
jgi:hypothetical protein